ncbi:MAG: glycine cleavage system protein GcvH [Candidatus Hodarchaeaceae archaeon]|nr:glycine cleavage system protein GcvH [Candidatus Hodarchaeaceae archaeon]
MKVGGYEVPEDLYYSREHEWVRVEGKLARVGVTDYAQKRLGDVVYVELPEVGRRVEQASETKSKAMELGALESIKAVVAIYAPLSGVVEDVNQALRDRPELVNTDPYGEGWVCLVEASNLETELKNLMSASAYAEFLKGLK